jgi:hypothetical protein
VHNSACVRMRAESACSTRLIRSGGVRCVVCTCTYREHAKCIRRSLRAGAGANNSAGDGLKTHAQRAFAPSLGQKPIVCPAAAARRGLVGANGAENRQRMLIACAAVK